MRDPLLPRLFHKAAHVRNDRVTLVVPGDNALLHINNEEWRVGSVLECGHVLPFFMWDSRFTRSLLASQAPNALQEAALKRRARKVLL